LEGDVFIKLFAGPRARFSDIQLEGAESVSPEVVLRELPFSEGSLFRESALTEGQRQVFGLNLFQLATVNVVDGQPRDSTVDVIVRVREGPPRFINALTGYYSDGGMTGSAQWTHRNFTGGARAFTASLRAQTGVGAVSPLPEIDYEARLSLRQPYIFQRSLSASVEPFARYRDDAVEKSTQYGVESSLLLELGPLRTATLSGTVSRRTVGADSTNLIDVSTLLPGDAFTINRSELSLSSIFGNVDDPLNPSRGFVVRTSASVSGLIFDESPFGTLGATATGYLPLSEGFGVVARGSGGVFLPLRGTDPADQATYLAVRDELFFAGGTNDVRGWANNLLGARFLDFTTIDTDFEYDSTAATSEYYAGKYSVRYRPVGAEAKASVSLQLNLPFPPGPQWGTSLFVDAGRVWSPAQGLYSLYGNVTNEFPGLADLITLFEEDQARIRFGVGASIQYLTPVGFLSIGLGWKINPSYFDVRSANSIFRRADIEDIDPGPADFSTIEEQVFRRLQFHFSFGQRF
ncbi:MAG: BamA/TamA family outer membrane protein, partial [Rubricoccaceae bacterium]|nr:BamA/TamA family outer membrane protein [Rubricoccaceae bacterium]